MDDAKDEYNPQPKTRHEYQPPEHEIGHADYKPPEREIGHADYQPPEREIGDAYYQPIGHADYQPPEREIGHAEYQPPEHEIGHAEYQPPEHEIGHGEYQPEFEAGPEYQPDMEAEHEYETENDSEEESDPEEEEEEEEEDGDEEEVGQEYQPEQEVEEGYQPGPLNEEEYQPVNESELVYERDQEHVHRDEDDAIEDEMPENSHPDEKQENDSEPAAVAGDKWPGWPGESVFRMLVPAQKVGSIIGRKGEYIKKTCEETKARIKILDGPPGCRERAVMVSAKEELNSPCPPAVDGLLRVHKRVLDGLENDSSVPTPTLGGKVSTRLLVPAAQAGSLIGKQGTTVKSIQEESNCTVRVLDELPIFALQDDRVVEVVGEATGIHKALELIATHLRKFLVDRSIISVIEMQMQTPTNPPMDHVPPPQNWGGPPQSYPQPAHGGPGYGASPRFMPQSRQYDNYYPPADMTPPEKQAHLGISAYGREAPISVVHSSSGGLTPSSVITQVIQQMQIPLSYADAVIGTHGSSISYIRRVSGATVTIQETRGVPTEMTVEISGTASQVQTAQQLIQNFMAQAAGSTQQQNPPPAADQMYSSYGSVYASPASNPSHAPQTGGYSSGYGNNYGY